MGKTKEELGRKDEFRQLTKYIYDQSGTTYQGQAGAIGMSHSRMQGIRSEKDERYTPHPEEIQAVREAFRDVLAGYGEPTELEKELLKYKALYEKALAAGDAKDQAIQDLTAALAEITAQIRNNKGEE